MTLKYHKDLDVWKDSIELVVDIYNLTSDFPTEEKYSIVSQLRRAAVSVPSNIAEGAARNSVKEFVQFLYIALGSLSEIDTQLIISQKLDFINSDAPDIFKKIQSIRKQIFGLIRSLKTKQ